MKFLLCSLSALALALTPQIAMSEVVIHTKNGQRYTVDVNQDDIEKIEFNESNQVGSNWQGRWETSEGKMDLSQKGKQVSGTYSQDDGRIEGTVINKTLNGYWIEAGSARQCSYRKQNSFYWGRISWEIDAQERSFAGKWSYCDDEPSSNWTGRR